MSLRLGLFAWPYGMEAVSGQTVVEWKLNGQVLSRSEFVTTVDTPFEELLAITGGAAASFTVVAFTRHVVAVIGEVTSGRDVLECKVSSTTRSWTMRQHADGWKLLEGRFYSAASLLKLIGNQNGIPHHRSTDHR